ncbi:MAG TPA: CBS domain-containing protein [Candidatus Limnocylindrales bacterium]|nr:CBS domain-containing protein [Candidatus Limnocylindrales bacterium]
MNGIPVARILGFEIRLPLSWIFIIAIITVTVGTRLEPFLPGDTQAISWAVGLAASLGFLASVVVHELAHAVVARRDGSETTVLLVQFIGSPSAVDVIASSPRAEGAVAIAGPLSSALIGGACVLAALVFLAIGSALEAIADGLLIVGALDLLLAGVSLVPAFPLDGARVVRAVAWARTGNRRSGTRIAGVIGKYAGRVILVVGFAIVVVSQELTLDGIMLGLAGWFLIASARSVDRWLILDDLIQGMSVGEAMEHDMATISPQLTLDTFASGLLDGTVAPALPVLEADELVGIVGASQVKAVARRNWAATRTADIMVAPPEMPTARPEDRLADALESLRRTHLDGLPVLDGSTLRGVLTRRSIAILLHARAEAQGTAIR